MCKAKRLLLLGAILVLTIVLAEGGHTQDKYPSKPIDIIVSYSAGGGTDLINRIMASYLNKKWGVPVNVINKPGGNHIPATLELYGAKPDGYTILADSSNCTSMLVVGAKNIPFNVMDRTFISAVSYIPQVLAVPSSSPIKNLKDLEAEIKKDPGKFTWASLGGTGLVDISIRQYLKAIGVDVLKTKPIMCQGGAQTVTLVAGGHVMVGGGTPPTCIPALKAGTIRGIAITSKQRWQDLKDIPTAVEQGYPTVITEAWYGPSGPPKLPLHIVDFWDRTMREMVNDPEVIEKWKKVGAAPFYLNAKATKELVAKEIEEFKNLGI